MRIAKVAAVLVGFSALAACSGEPDGVLERSEPVVNGKILTEAEAKASSIVQITVPGFDLAMKPVRMSGGSGMLLSPTVVLTAAHVIDHNDTKDIEVVHAHSTPSAKTVKIKNRILSNDYYLQRFVPGVSESDPIFPKYRVDLGVLILKDPITPTAPFPIPDCDPKPTKVTVNSANVQPNTVGIGLVPIANVADFNVTSRVLNFFTVDMAPNPAPLKQAVFGGDSGSGVTDFTSKKYVGWVKTHDTFLPDPGFLDLKLKFASVFEKTRGQFTKLVPLLCSVLNSHISGAVFPNKLEAGSVASFLQQVDKDLREDVISLTPIAEDTAALTIDRSQLGKQTFEVTIPEQASVSGGALGNFDGKGQSLAVIQDDQLAMVAFNKGPKPALTGAPGSSYKIVSKVSVEGDTFDDLVAQRLSGEIDVFKGSATGLAFAANIKPFGIRLDNDMLSDFVWLDGLARIHTVTTKFGHFSQNVVPDTLRLDKGVAGRFRALSGENEGIEDFVVMGDDLAILCESTTFGGFVCERSFEGPEVSGRHVTDITAQDLTADGFDDLKLDYSDASPRVVLGQSDGFGPSSFGFLVRAAFPVDVNGDNELDTMTLDDPDGLLEVGVRIQPEGAGDFTFPTTIPFTDPQVIAVGNLNDDGVEAGQLADGFNPIQDVAILAGGSVYVFISNGDGSFETTQLGAGTNFADLAIADTNGDGIDDVEAVESDGSVTVFAGSSTGVEEEGINFTGLPTPSSTDGKMLVLSGLGVDTVAATQSRFRITAASGADLNRLVVDVFDGDNGGLHQFEEQTSLLKTCYRLSADPCGDGNLGNCAGGLRPPVHLVTVTSDTLGDDKWDHIYDGPHSAQASFAGNGQAPFVYELRVFLAEDCSEVPAAGSQISIATADAFKVRANAMVSQPLGEFSFVGSSSTGAFGVAQPYMRATDYDGRFNLPIAVGSSATEIQLKESDADDTQDATAGVSLGANADIQYRLLRPNGTEAPVRGAENVTAANVATNVSGNNNGTTALDVETRIHTIGGATPGVWTWQWQNVGASNSVHVFAPFGSPTTHEILGARRERPVLTNARQPTFWQEGSELAAALPVTLGAASGNSIFIGGINEANDILSNPSASLEGELVRQLLTAKLNVKRSAQLGEQLQAALIYGRTVSVRSAIARADAVLSGANLLATERDIRDVVALLSSLNLGEVTYQWPGVPFPDEPMVDDDGDGVVNVKDNCPPIANPLQEDSDDDWIGDACRVTTSACVLERVGGIKQAFFSYDNPLSFRGLPVGARNRVTLRDDELLDAPQPVELAGGFVSNGFSRVLGDSEPLAWLLDGGRATADLATQACSGREVARLDHVPATALFATEALELGDYTSVESSDGRLASVASAGDLTVGPGSLVGNAIAGGRLEVKELAAVLGVGLAGQGMTRAADALVGLSKEGVLPEHSLEWLVEFSADGADEIVGPRQQVALDPGRYGHVVVEDQAQLILRAGAYQFASLTVAAQGNVQLGAGEVVVHVASALEHDGETDLAPGASLVLAYFGSSAAYVSSSLHATVIASRATLTLGELPNSVYTGAFFAKRLTVRPTTQVFFSER